MRIGSPHREGTLRSGAWVFAPPRPAQRDTPGRAGVSPALSRRPACCDAGRTARQPTPQTTQSQDQWGGCAHQGLVAQQQARWEQEIREQRIPKPPCREERVNPTLKYALKLVRHLLHSPSWLQGMI